MNLQRAIRYDSWANHEALKALKQGNTPSQAIDVLAHIVAVSQLWLSRVVSEPCPKSMWPGWTLVIIEAEMGSCFARWENHLSSSHIDQKYDYVNSKGKR